LILTQSFSEIATINDSRYKSHSQSEEEEEEEEE